MKMAGNRIEKFQMIARGLTLTDVCTVLKVMDLETEVNIATELVQIWRASRYKPCYPRYSIGIDVKAYGRDMAGYIRRRVWRGFRRVKER